MKKAVPVDKDGCTIGGIKNFTDNQWEMMVYNYGKKLRWVLVPEESEKTEKKSKDRGIFRYDIPLPEDEDLTKRELIKKYGLSEDLMKNTKPEIIETINESELSK